MIRNIIITALALGALYAIANFIKTAAFVAVNY